MPFPSLKSQWATRPCSAPATADRNSQHLGLWLHRIWETNRVNYYGKLDWRSALAKKVSSYDPLKEWDTRDVAIPIVFFDQEKKSLPVLVSKMRLAGDWNSHPRDLANLTAWLSEQRKETLDWQVVNPEVPAQELGRANRQHWFLVTGGSADPTCVARGDLRQARLYIPPNASINSAP